MQVICQTCKTRFEAKDRVTLDRPPQCPKCKAEDVKAKPINETVRFDDRPGERPSTPVKEREVRG